MSLDFRAAQVREALHAFDFQRLFLDELGWDNPPGNLVIEVDGQDYRLEAVAEKSGLTAYVQRGADLPDRAARMKIERATAAQVYEHVLIFTDGDRTRQVWQWVKRQPGRSPLYREHTLHKGQTGEPLIQKLRHLAFSLWDEPSIADVSGRARKAFDVDRVTKRFYSEFKARHDTFLEFVDGIPSDDHRRWYASLTLNRLMFVYFIQKKGFLDDDPDYLRNRLAQVQQRRGRGQFLSFYRRFLRRFFHEGVGQPPKQRDAELDALIGRVPYLNGGIFDEHDLEKSHRDIEIDDLAFVQLFDFFDAYQWRLDERPLRADNEINPDVLGYIFEKYVNQKQMGAYYTKEDITGYITQNTVIPRLFDMARRDCAIAFQPDGAVWRLLRENPDRYVYASVRQGVDRPLPDEIAAGLDDTAQRGGWNEPADDDFALPTETWREHVARRQRYEEVWERLAAGQVTEVNDLVTLNLDIRQFAQDVILDCEGPELLRAVWKALRRVSVLDPTCGSGAFLFAALHVLEPLYDACLERMEAFCTLNEYGGGVRRSSKRFSDFRACLKEAATHPNRRYYILKSIIVQNLYGVDIMAEAVEICKLRLFLKLAAQAATVDELEPLPDVDFNIRAGNTLVGFTSLDAVRAAMRTVAKHGVAQGKLPFESETLARIEEQADDARRAFDRFREQQTTLGGAITPAHKANLRRRLNTLAAELDQYLASEYGVDPADPKAYTRWRTSHQPFHWFAEFYGIMSRGGFDVVIGNPPYVEYRTIKGEYSLVGLETVRCGNLYAMIWERSINLATKGHLGMIVPASAMCTDGYAVLRKLLINSGSLSVSSFSNNPGKLFDGIHNRLQIILLKRSGDKRVFTTAYNKWRGNARQHIFHALTFIEIPKVNIDSSIVKIGNELELSILRKVNSFPLVSEQQKERSPRFTIYYTRKLSATFFLQILNFIPAIYGPAGKLRKPSELKEVHFDDALIRDGTLGVLNSSLFSWLVQVFSDCRNLNHREVSAVRFDLSDTEHLSIIAGIAKELMGDIDANSKFKTRLDLKIQQTFPRQSKKLIDKLDAVLAKHYGFTDEELDYIVNYDIKYRMGLRT